MSDFIKKVLKNLAVTIASFALLLVVYLLVILVVGSIKVPPVNLKEGTVLVFDVSEGISDAPDDMEASELLFALLSGEAGQTPHLRAITGALRAAAEDDRIAGLFITGNISSEGFASTYAALAEVRGAVEAFRASGKPTHAYLDAPSKHTYFLASSAETVAINPLGIMELNGIAASFVYLKDALEKYGIGVQAPRAGRYKSAVEMFTRSSMSPAQREQSTSLVEGLWEELLVGYGRSRGETPQRLDALAQDSGLLNARQAVDAGLVDHTAFWDEMLETLDAIAPVEEADALTFRQVSMADYIEQLSFEQGKAVGTDKADHKQQDKPQIAVIYAEGEIVDGKGERGQIGGEALARELRLLRKGEDKPQAVVLRVNSPGGSAYAAEMIERELARLGEDVPLVVSMGGYAASGGYWIAARADHIVAQPMTITGSIGVFGLIPNVQEIAGNNGILFDVVKTAPLADIGSISRPKSEAEMETIQVLIDDIYQTFLERVAEGRGKTIEEVRTLAEGRVWLGKDALDVGLVDELGGLEEAIAKAAELADIPLESAEIVEIPAPRSLEEVFKEALEDGELPLSLSQLKATAPLPLEATLERKFPILRALRQPLGIYARLPMDMHFH